MYDIHFIKINLIFILIINIELSERDLVKVFKTLVLLIQKSLIDVDKLQSTIAD